MRIPESTIRRRRRIVVKSKKKVESNSIKCTIEQFESKFTDKDKLFYIESTENIQGNYFKYVSNVLRNLKNFDKIDFLPAVMKKKIYLENSVKKCLFIDLDEISLISTINMTAT